MGKSERGVRPGSGRETSLRRRPSSRIPRQTVLICTNGKSTEQAYFNALKGLPWAQQSRVVVIFKNGAPVEVVRDAFRRKDANDYDEAWAICDVDDFDTDKATVEARRKSVGFAWANPCFELWLILHLAEHSAHIEDAGKACGRISKLLGRDYDKTSLDFAVFERGITDAVARAKLLGQHPRANPSTNIWAVLECIRYKE